jgi:hypothetical protein
MSSSSVDEVGTNEVTQEICEQRIVIRFDYPRGQDGPHIGMVILRFLGFGIVTIIGIDLDEAQVGDVAVKLAHNGFYTRAQIWLKLRDGARGWGSTLELQKQYHYTSYLA